MPLLRDKGGVGAGVRSLIGFFFPLLPKSESRPLLCRKSPLLGLGAPSCGTATFLIFFPPRHERPQVMDARLSAL